MLARKLCGCGCGGYDILGRDYIIGHPHKRLPRKFCECGCGLLASPGKRFVKYHYWRTKEALVNAIKQGEELKGIPQSDETKEKQKEGMKRRLPRPEVATLRTKLGWVKRKKRLKKEAQKRAASFIKSSTDENNRKVVHIHVHKGLTKPERKLRRGLNRLFPEEYKFVGNGLVFIGYKCPDFINVNGQKKIIELFGDYWHSEKLIGMPVEEHMKQRISHFAEYGFETLIVWESELKNIPQLKKKLKKFHCG